MRRLVNLIAFIMMLAALTACDAISPTGVPEPGESQAAGLYLDQPVLMWKDTFSENGQAPDYTITADIPQLMGSSDGRVMNFNSQMISIVHEEVNVFKENLSMLPAEPITGGSSLVITYEFFSSQENLYSLRFQSSYYSDGAAHPGSSSRTATFDLNMGRMLVLADLFIPKADYLSLLSDYCLSSLRASEFGDALFEGGATPMLENYKSWNLTSQGVLITFDVYQVVAYAAGPQQVLVPYTELQGMIDPQGPIREYLP